MTNLYIRLEYSVTFYSRVTSLVPTHPGKSLNLRKEFSRPGKSWKVTVVIEKSWESQGIPPIGHGIFNRRIIFFVVLTIKLKEYKITVSKTNV